MDSWNFSMVGYDPKKQPSIVASWTADTLKAVDAGLAERGWVAVENTNCNQMVVCCPELWNSILLALTQKYTPPKLWKPQQQGPPMPKIGEDVRLLVETVLKSMPAPAPVNVTTPAVSVPVNLKIAEQPLSSLKIKRDDQGRVKELAEVPQ